MVLITYKGDNGYNLAFLIGDRIYDCHRVHPSLPKTGEDFVAQWQRLRPLALLMHNALQINKIKTPVEYIQINEAEEVRALILPEVL